MTLSIRFVLNICILFFFWLLMFAPSIYSSIKSKKTYRSPNIVGSSFYLIYMLFIPITAYIDGKFYKTFELYFDIFVVVIAYAIFLLLFNKLFRKHCSAGLCASLWSLIGVLFIYAQGILTDSAFLNNAPKLMIPIPENTLIIAGSIWSAGFILYVGLAFYKHFKFSAYMNKDAKPFNNSLYTELSKELKAGEDCELYISPNATTPITVGVWNLKLFLPEHTYSDEELNRIFRHEITHIKNRDNYTKLLVTFVNGIVWFIPFIWRSNSLAAEDIELNCDETILADATDAERKFYAGLILNVGNECKGFNTCLSATGECIKYRLTEIIHPQKDKLFKDIIVSGIALTILFLSPGLIRFSSEYGTLANFETIKTDYQIESSHSTINEKELYNFITDQRVFCIGNDPFFEGSGKELTLINDSEEYEIEFGNHEVQIVNIYKDEEGYNDYEVETYYIPNNSWKKIFDSSKRAQELT